MGNRIVISDLDGTLSDPTRRLRLYKKGDYKAFNKAGKEDKPIENVCNMVRGLKDSETDIVVITARDESCREDTIEWLRLYDVPCDKLLMRGCKDDRPDADVKRDLFNENLNFSDVWFVLEDRTVCVDMWRGEGLTCLQVAPGDF